MIRPKVGRFSTGPASTKANEKVIDKEINDDNGNGDFDDKEFNDGNENGDFDSDEPGDETMDAYLRQKQKTEQNGGQQNQTEGEPASVTKTKKNNEIQVVLTLDENSSNPSPSTSKTAHFDYSNMKSSSSSSSGVSPFLNGRKRTKINSSSTSDKDYSNMKSTSSSSSSSSSSNKKLEYHFKRTVEHDKVIRYCKLVAGFAKIDLYDLIKINEHKEARDVRGKIIKRRAFYEFSDSLYSPWYEVMEEVKKSMDETKREELNHERGKEETDFGIDAYSYGASETCAFENEWLFQRFVCNETFVLYVAKFTNFLIITGAVGLTLKYETAKMMEKYKLQKNNILLGLWRAMKQLDVLRDDLYSFVE